jgi:hypothetical protein
MRLALALAATALVAACATPRPAPPPEFTLRLAPASLGRELALQQRMTVTAFGRSQQLDVALEVDAQALHLAVLDFGQTVARLDWDGHDLQESKARGWPDTVTGARVLSDVQWVQWPVDAIRPALPAGWTLEASDAARVVRYQGAPVIRVRYPRAGVAELDNLAAHYQVRLLSAPELP